MKTLIEKWAGKAIIELGTSKRAFDAGDSDNAIRYGGLATGIMSVVKDMEAALPEWEARDAELTRLRAEVERLEADNKRLAAVSVQVDAWGLELLKGLGGFLTETAKEGGPKRTRIRCEMPDGTKQPVVWLWATTDRTAPEARVGDLREQLNEAEAEVSRLTAALATETRAVERLAGAVSDMSFAEPGAGCPDGLSRCIMEGATPDCAACWAAWARQPATQTKED